MDWRFGLALVLSAVVWIGWFNVVGPALWAPPPPAPGPPAVGPAPAVAPKPDTPPAPDVPAAPAFPKTTDAPRATVVLGDPDAGNGTMVVQCSSLGACVEALTLRGWRSRERTGPYVPLLAFQGFVEGAEGKAPLTQPRPPL